MLQINDNNANVSAHDISLTTPLNPSVDKTDLKVDYHALKSRILESAEQSIHWMCKLAAALREMRESKAYKVEYSTWDDFCGSIQVPGFNRFSGRYANNIITALNRKEEWARSGTIVPIWDEMMQLSEGVVREIARAPKEDQPGIVSRLISDGKPTMKRAKALVRESSIPPLKELIRQWSRVGDVTRISKYPGGFHVCNKDLPWIDWTFQNRESAWNTWQEKGEEYIDAMISLQKRKAEAAQQSEPAIDVESVVVEPTQITNSCYSCVHHEHNMADGFDCKARNFPLGLEEDLGSDCNFWKQNNQKSSGVAEFSLKNQSWATIRKPQRPFSQELELLGRLLDSLAEERAYLEEEGTLIEEQSVIQKISLVGKTLQTLIAEL